MGGERLSTEAEEELSVSIEAVDALREEGAPSFSGDVWPNIVARFEPESTQLTVLTCASGLCAESTFVFCFVFVFVF